MDRLRSFLPLGLILLAAFLARFIFLDSVPTAINNDQLHYILNAKSFLLTGMDLSNTITIFEVLLFRYPLNELPQAELPFFLLTPFLAFLPLSLSAVVLPNVLLSVGTVAILYLIALRLFNKNIALITALVATFNPWFVFIGRTFYEVVPATFFYLCFIYVLLIAKKWKILYAAPFMLLAFYSYIGTKLVFLPVIFLTILYVYFFENKKKYAKEYSILFLFSLIIVGFFLLQISQGSDTSRLSEIVTPNHPSIVEGVDEARKVSLQHPMIPVFENKITMYVRLLTENLLNVLSFKYLFFEGDGFFSIERHGLFYVLDAVFLFIGAGWLYIYKKKLFFLFLLLIGVSTLPQIIHDPEASGNFTPHIALLFPFFIMLIATGIYQVTSALPGRKYPLLSGVIISCLYFFFVANFFHVYFSQLPMRTGLFDYPSRLLARYSVLAEEQGGKVTVYSPETTIAYKKHLFYTNGVNKETIEDIKSVLGKGRYSQGATSFLPCNDDEASATPSGIIVHDKICGKPTGGNALGLPQLKDSGSMFLIYNDNVCTNYSHPQFVESLRIYDLDVKAQPVRDFCEKFVLRVE